MKILKRFEFNSPVILSFVLISFAAYLLNDMTNGKTNDLLFCVYRSSFTDPLFYIRLIGHIFGHAGWSHFSGNIIMILLLGPLLEEKYGSRNMISIIGITALVTGLIHIAFFDSGLLGASGVVFALVLLSSITSLSTGKIPLTFVIVAVIYIGGQVVDGITTRDNISNLTHIVGGVLGCTFGYALNSRGKRR